MDTHVQSASQEEPTVLHLTTQRTTCSLARKGKPIFGCHQVVGSQQSHLAGRGCSFIQQASPTEPWEGRNMDPHRCLMAPANRTRMASVRSHRLGPSVDPREESSPGCWVERALATITHVPPWDHKATRGDGGCERGAGFMKRRPGHALFLCHWCWAGMY